MQIQMRSSNFRICILALCVQLLAISSLLAQVSIQERVVIAPGQHSRGSAPLNDASDTTEVTICLMNPTMIYYPPPSGGGHFYLDSGYFQLPSGFSTPVRLHGGTLTGSDLGCQSTVGI
jgi:hypothetical protein